MLTADPATTLATMPRPDLIDAATEAALVGRSPARVSRARRQPGHPARLVVLLLDHQDGTTTPDASTDLTAARLIDRDGNITPRGHRLLRDRVRESGPKARQPLAPVDEVLAWWPPAGTKWTTRQWAALRRIADGTPAHLAEPSPVVLTSMVGLGGLDTDHQITPEGLRLLGRTPQEQSA